MKCTTPADALRELVARLGSQHAAAQHLGVSDSYLSDLVGGRRDFSRRMLAKLGFKRTVTVTFQRAS